MGYLLKKEANEFQVTRDGDFAYHSFRHGVTYEKVPEEEKHLFISVIVDEGGEDE